jgi:aminocarboxymuconate-semialdehyde decarboxylase
LPIEHPLLAARIARHWISEGHAQFAAPCGAPNVMLSDEAYEELWIALDSNSSFLFMHPGEGCDGRLTCWETEPKQRLPCHTLCFQE